MTRLSIAELMAVMPEKPLPISDSESESEPESEPEQAAQ
jgi:hypothetical protein